MGKTKTLAERAENKEFQKMVSESRAAQVELSAAERERIEFQERAGKLGFGIAVLTDAVGSTPAHSHILNGLREIRHELTRALKSGVSPGDLTDLLDHHSAQLESAWVKDSLKEQVQRYGRLGEIKIEFMKEHPEPTLEQMMRAQAAIGSLTDEEISKAADRYIANGGVNGHYENPYKLELIAARLRGSKYRDSDLTFKLLRGAMDDYNYSAQHLNTEEGKALAGELQQFEKSPGNFQVLMKTQKGHLAPFPVRFKEVMSDLLEVTKKEIASTPVSERYKD